MIDLHISGATEEYPVDFTVDGETKTVDSVCKDIHFSLEENKEYRVYFEQKTPKYLPRGVEILLEILFLPLRGLFNVITFNVKPDWEKDISAFSVSGYFDVKPKENTDLSFRLKPGKYYGKAFSRPDLVFSSETEVRQTAVPAPEAIFSGHGKYLKNISSVGLLFFALFIYLLSVAVGKENPAAIICVSAVLVFGVILLGYLIFGSFKKRKTLLAALRECGEDS